METRYYHILSFVYDNKEIKRDFPNVIPQYMPGQSIAFSVERIEKLGEIEESAYIVDRVNHSYMQRWRDEHMAVHYVTLVILKK